MGMAMAMAIAMAAWFGPGRATLWPPGSDRCQPDPWHPRTALVARSLRGWLRRTPRAVAPTGTTGEGRRETVKSDSSAEIWKWADACLLSFYFAGLPERALGKNPMRNEGFTLTRQNTYLFPTFWPIIHKELCFRLKTCCVIFTFGIAYIDVIARTFDDHIFFISTTVVKFKWTNLILQLFEQTIYLQNT